MNFFKLISASMYALAGFVPLAGAETVGHWRFEEEAYLEDSSGNNHTLAVGVDGEGPVRVSQYALPESGPGSAFPKTIQGSANRSAAKGVGPDNGFRRSPFAVEIPRDGERLTRQLTIEAFINLSFSANLSSSVIAGQGVLASEGAGWGLIITSQNSPVGAQKLVFQFNKKGGPWNEGLAMVDSGVVIDLHKDYYVAVSADFSDPSPEGITLYVKNLTDNEEMRALGFPHHAGYTRIAATEAPLIIGGGAGAVLPFYGVIDEVRLSDEKLPREKLLMTQ